MIEFTFMKILFVFFALITFFSGVWLGKEYVQKDPQARSGILGVSQGQEQNNSKKAEITILPPRTLSIPKLGVEVFVESVGMDSEGKMDIPKNVDNVAWYNLGYKPGEKGSAVIAGHYDKKDGSPAVFYTLSSLQPGDEIEVIDTNGKKLAYVVTRKASYLTDQFPLKEVFDTRDKPRLNLITCAGTWNRGQASYSNRLVVYSELKP